MGGSIGFTIRETSGKEHRMCRWTNVMPYFFKNLDFINMNQKHIDDFLIRWYEMSEDYKSHINTGAPMEHNMTDVYAPNPFLAPIEYGLVVVDYKTNTILTAQQYCSVDKIDFVSMILYNHNSIDEEEKNNIKKLFDENIIISYNTYHKLNRYDPKMLTFDYVIKNIDKIHKKSKFGYFQLDMKQWSIFDYDPHQPESMKDMKQHIIKLGFELTEEENQIWEQWLNCK